MTRSASSRAITVAAGILLALALAPAARARTITRPTWIRALVTEYYSVPERWFVGKRVRAPGLDAAHRVDWLYSSLGVSMEGDGVGLDGRHYHLCAGFAAGWLQRNGRPTSASTGFKEGRPFWRATGYWRNRRGHVTFPLGGGSWFDGRGVRHRRPQGQRFCRGSSRKLKAYETLAVDPRLIPLGSRVFIPFYRRQGLGTGWFVARDTGGAIRRRHVDAYVPAPAVPFGPARSLPSQRIKVVPPIAVAQRSLWAHTVPAPAVDASRR